MTKENSESLWWKQPLRVIQPNMQVRDTHHINPDRLAKQLSDMGANTAVFNVGGIYAWYKSEVPEHTINEYLPENTDLLMDIINALHKRNIRFIARFDFSKAEDSIYLRNPQWFVRDINREPQIIGSKRPGNWSLLMSTCINGEYRTDQVAIPVLTEVMDRYPIDGIFFNNPGYIACHCSACKRKYFKLYGEKLPEDIENFHSDWATQSMKDNIDVLYSHIKQKNKDIPLILYYNLYRDNLSDRATTADMLCTEPQDVLSLGYKNIPETWMPALSIKLGRSLPDRPNPYGIVHSSPGMDWRHTGLPPAEYQFWLSQIPANGGQIWHSITGIPDTITDKRIIEVVTEHNNMVKKVEPYMGGAVSNSQVALIWNASPSSEGWADGFLERQIPFDVLLIEEVENEDLDKYDVVIVPEKLQWTPSVLTLFKRYTSEGGNLIIEGIPDIENIHDFLGIYPDTYEGEELIASYLSFEGKDNFLQKGLEETEMIAFRGKVVYCNPKQGTDVLTTLVPPFSPLESVGAPPERASLLVEKTSIPLVLHQNYKKGRILTLPFSLSFLINEFRLNEHYCLLNNLVKYMTDGSLNVEVTHSPGLQVTVFKKNEKLLIHLVNGAGRRPLTNTLPIHNICIRVKSPIDQSYSEAKAIISDNEVDVGQESGILTIHLSTLNVWEALVIS